MYIPPDKNRLSKLDLSKAKLRDSILFCPKCNWQSEPNNIGMKPICPECGKWLQITTVDQDLFDSKLDYD
jgi:ssDNA-binding Zn-finger/Zn-ribbon topoisomerase 1